MPTELLAKEWHMKNVLKAVLFVLGVVVVYVCGMYLIIQSRLGYLTGWDGIVALIMLLVLLYLARAIYVRDSSRA